LTLEAFRLQNFMAFQDTGWLELRPITLLFGRNSSGKSALIRALRLLKQSLDHVPSESPLLFSAEDGVDLGNFKTAVHKQELNRIMTFQFRCCFTSPTTGALDILYEKINQHRQRYTKPPLEELQPNERILELSLGFAWDKKRQQVLLVSIEIASPREEDAHYIVFQAFRDRLELGNLADKPSIQVESSEDWTWDENWLPWSEILHGHETSRKEYPWLQLKIGWLLGFLPVATVLANTDRDENPELASDFRLIQELFSEFQYEIENFLRQIAYLGPVRPTPDRIYSLNRFEKLRWERTGLKTFVDFLSENIDDAKAREIGKQLPQLELGKAIKARKFYTDQFGLTSQVEVDEGKTKKENTLRVNLTDVGFGVSQVLPVLVQSILANPGSLVIIEQPELHLHPSAQAGIADVFIRSIYKIAMDEKSNKLEAKLTGARFLLETHSEHVFLRLRRRIAETTSQPEVSENDPYLRSDAFRAYFIERDSSSLASWISPVAISDLGELTQVPKSFGNFFADGMNEVVDLSHVQLRIRKYVRK